jgi:hypothetical protein
MPKESQLDYNTRMTETFGGYTNPDLEAEWLAKWSKEVKQCKTRESLIEFLTKVQGLIENTVEGLSEEPEDHHEEDYRYGEIGCS